MMKSSELGPTGLFPHRPRRRLRSQTYSMHDRFLSCCDALQASVHHRAQGEEGVLELDSALIKESLVIDEAKGTDASKDTSLLDNGVISNLGREELVVLDGVTLVENRSTLSPGREHDGGSGNVVCESVNTCTPMEAIAEAVRSVGIDNDGSAVNFFDGVEQELEELIFSPQNIDLPIADEGAEEGEISGDEGAFDLLFGDSLSLEEKKSDDLLLVSEVNVENGNDGDGQEGKFMIKSSPLLDKIEGGNDARNLERRSLREEPNVGAKSFRDNASSNYEDLDGGLVAEQVRRAQESHHSVISAENLAQRRQVTYEDIIDKKVSATAPLEVGNEKKRKRGPLTEERKAKRKRKDRIKRAEKNRQLGVKRLKLEPVVKPKKVVYCRHYMVGRCHEGEKCKFSHDATPLTKSTPCSFLARHSCMKGDDCPFDHELSKYPCNNFVSKGFCSRGADCLFKHEVSNINDPLLISKLSNPELKSQLPTGSSNSKNHVNNNDGVANRHSHTKLSPLNHSTGELSENQASKNPIPRGINFISQVRSPITNAKKPEEAAPKLEADRRAKSSSSTVSSLLDNIKKSDETAKKEPLRVPKGINFLSFGKSPLGISANKEKGTVGIPAESVVPSSTSFDTASSVLAHSQEKRNAGDTTSTPNCSSALGSHTLNPWKTPVISNTPSPVQRALQSTLAFAAKIDSGIRLNIPTDNPFDACSSASTSTFKG